MRPAAARVQPTALTAARSQPDQLPCSPGPHRGHRNWRPLTLFAPLLHAGLLTGVVRFAATQPYLTRHQRRRAWFVQVKQLLGCLARPRGTGKPWKAARSALPFKHPAGCRPCSHAACTALAARRQPALLTPTCGGTFVLLMSTLHPSYPQNSMHSLVGLCI